MDERKTYEEAVELLKKGGLDKWTLAQLESLGYFAAPASRARHLAVRGGLALHSANVTRRLVEITEKHGIEWPRAESPYLVGMLHDLCKTQTYVAEGEGYAWRPTVYGGHGSASALIALSDLGIRLLPEETASIVWHMGAFELDRRGLEEYHRGIDAYGSFVIATHTADMIASQIDERR